MRNVKSLVYGVITMLAFAACEDNDYSGGNEQDEESIILSQQPTADEIKIRYQGKGCYAGILDDLIENHLKPRVQENGTDLSDADLDVVIMSEAFAGEVLNDQTKFEQLKTLWNKQRAVGFIEPESNAIELLDKLRNQSFDYRSEITSEMVSDFNKIKLFVTVAGLKNYVHDKYNDPIDFQVTETSIEENQSVTESQYVKQIPVKMDGYHLGQVAEGLCAWLNQNVAIEDGVDPALVKSRSDSEYTYGSSATEWVRNLSISYQEVSEYNDPTFSARTFSTTTQVKAIGAYCGSDNSDLYDIEVLDKFPISQIYYQNYLLDQYGAVDYKDKYTGYCYRGPEVELNLKDASGKEINSGVGIYSASPQIENETLSTTHYPATASFGSSVSGGVSSEGPGLSVGLSSSFTLPYDATTYAYKEMKFNYSEGGGKSKWEYYHDGYWIYNWTWGFNGKFNNVYGPAKNDSDFSFMLTFKLPNSRSYGEQDVYLDTKMSYGIYSEVCKPKKHTRYSYHWGPFNRSFLLPVVYRYFGKYAPSYYSATISATDDDWVNLKSMLEDNPTYRALCDDAIMVGARVETTADGRNGVEAQAERIWIETMNSIIQQRNGHTYVDGEWVIGLYGEGSWLKKGLHIKGNNWEIVDDVTEYDHLSPERE